MHTPDVLTNSDHVDKNNIGNGIIYSALSVALAIICTDEIMKKARIELHERKMMASC